jgi:hypothetical protein
MSHPMAEMSHMVVEMSHWLPVMMCPLTEVSRRVAGTEPS